MREESLAELADASRLGDDVALSNLVTADEPPDLALLDLSVLDGRFLPDLIEAELVHLLEAWEGAVIGPEGPFEALASAEARAALLRPAPGVRLVVHDPVLKSWKPTKLHLLRRPPAIELTLDVEAVRYLVDADGRPRAGNWKATRRMALTWTLENTGSAGTPWRLAVSNVPANEIPGWP